MNLQPENLSPDTTNIADAKIHANGSLSEVISTSMPAVHQQGLYTPTPLRLVSYIDTLIDSVFFRLPLELRFMIYDYAMNFDPQTDVMRFSVDHPETRKAVVLLIAISCQIRQEVHVQLAKKNCHVPIVMGKDRKMLPYTALRKYPTALKKGSSEWKDFNLDAPRNFKFSKLFLILRIKSSGTIAALFDHRIENVTVVGAKVGTKHAVTTLASIQESEKLSPEALGSTGESLIKAVEVVVKQDGFDGFTLGDMHLLLRDLKVSVPEPSGDFHIEYEDPEAKSIETGGD